MLDPRAVLCGPQCFKPIRLHYLLGLLGRRIYGAPGRARLFGPDSEGL